MNKTSNTPPETDGSSQTEISRPYVPAREDLTIAKWGDAAESIRAIAIETAAKRMKSRVDEEDIANAVQQIMTEREERSQSLKRVG